jgi:hypothetical protein
MKGYFSTKWTKEIELEFLLAIPFRSLAFRVESQSHLSGDQTFKKCSDQSIDLANDYPLLNLVTITYALGCRRHVKSDSIVLRTLLETEKKWAGLASRPLREN